MRSSLFVARSSALWRFPPRGQAAPWHSPTRRPKHPVAEMDHPGARDGGRAPLRRLRVPVELAVASQVEAARSRTAPRLKVKLKLIMLVLTVRIRTRAARRNRRFVTFLPARRRPVTARSDGDHDPPATTMSPPTRAFTRIAGRVLCPHRRCGHRESSPTWTCSATTSLLRTTSAKRRISQTPGSEGINRTIGGVESCIDRSTRGSIRDAADVVRQTSINRTMGRMWMSVRPWIGAIG